MFSKRTYLYIVKSSTRCIVLSSQKYKLSIRLKTATQGQSMTIHSISDNFISNLPK